MNDKIVKIVITEYLCDYCESVFRSPFFVRQHQKKSCMGVKIEKDHRDELKKIVYTEFYSRNPSKCEDCGIIFNFNDFSDNDFKDFDDWKDKKKKGLKCVKCLKCLRKDDEKTEKEEKDDEKDDDKEEKKEEKKKPIKIKNE